MLCPAMTIAQHPSGHAVHCVSSSQFGPASHHHPGLSLPTRSQCASCHSLRAILRIPLSLSKMLRRRGDYPQSSFAADVLRMFLRGVPFGEVKNHE